MRDIVFPRSFRKVDTVFFDKDTPGYSSDKKLVSYASLSLKVADAFVTNSQQRDAVDLHCVTLAVYSKQFVLDAFKQLVAEDDTGPILQINR